jgi:hypothetical protein
VAHCIFSDEPNAPPQWVDNLYFADDERFGAMGVSTSSSAYILFMARAQPV